MLLERPAHLRRGRRADRRGRLVVRVDERRLDVDVLELVRPERVHRRHLREEPSLAAVGAAVEDESRPSREKGSVAPRTRLELDDHSLAPVADGEELLVAREDELDGSSRGARERRDVALEVEVALRTEAPAEERHDHADVRLGNVERVGDARACGVGNLRRRPDRDPVALPLGDDRARLDRDALHGVGDDSARGRRRPHLRALRRRRP